MPPPRHGLAIGEHHGSGCHTRDSGDLPLHVLRHALAIIVSLADERQVSPQMPLRRALRRRALGERRRSGPGCPRHCPT